MSKIINYFLALTQIPHCSKETTKLRDYLVNFALDRDYTIEVDSVDNILIHKGSPKVALQAHYDMVCVGQAPNIETFEEDGWLKAKNSSLGADNGIAIAMMMELMDQGVEAEFLITNDEEIGLIGAKALNFDLKSLYMLNLDSEDEAEVYIGCAGGEDIVATKKYHNPTLIDQNIYEVSIRNLQGGHSGVDIDKDIPSAIKVLVEYLRSTDAKIISFEAGERRNSIPANAKAILYSTQSLPPHKAIEIKTLNEEHNYYENNILELLAQLPHGVLEHNREFNIPNSSANLALLSYHAGKADITITTRGMSTPSLQAASKCAIDVLKNHNYDYAIEDNYPSWKPDINSFTQLLNSTMIEEFGSSKYVAIHAGLECGVISDRYPHIKFASIGPTIEYPHSTSERLKIDSVERIFRVVEKVLDRV